MMELKLVHINKWGPSTNRHRYILNGIYVSIADGIVVLKQVVPLALRITTERINHYFYLGFYLMWAAILNPYRNISN